MPNSESESGIPNGKVLLNSNYALNSDQSSAPNQFLFKGESLKKIIANSIPKTYQSFKGEDVKVIAQEFGLYKELKTQRLFVKNNGKFQDNYESISGTKSSEIENISKEEQIESYSSRFENLVDFLIEEGVITDRESNLKQ